MAPGELKFQAAAAAKPCSEWLYLGVSQPLKRVNEDIMIGFRDKVWGLGFPKSLWIKPSCSPSNAEAHGTEHGK